MRIDPDRARDVRVTLVEAMQLLGSFDARLREYAARTLHRQGIHLVHGMVKEVREKEVELRSGDVMPYGLCVWSTGVGAPPLRSCWLPAWLLPKPAQCPMPCLTQLVSLHWPNRSVSVMPSIIIIEIIQARKSCGSAG